MERDKRQQYKARTEAYHLSRTAAEEAAQDPWTIHVRQHAGKVHTVKEGESIWTIAKKYNVSVSDVIAWNELDDDRIRIGWDLKILN